MAAPSFDDLTDAGKAEVVARRPDLAMRAGDISEMVIAAAAAMADRAIGWGADRFKATYLDGAKGDDLHTLTDDHWSVQVNPAAKAVGEVTLTRSGATAEAKSFLTGTVVATDRDLQGQEIRFVTLQDANWGVSENGAKTVNAEAETAGLAGNVEADKIVRIISASPGGGSYTVTNALLFAGGSEEEADDDLVERTRATNQALRRATLRALELGALEVDGIARATAVEEVVGGEKTGIVNVYVSDADGNCNSTLAGAVEAELVDWQAAGAAVNVIGGQPYTVDVQLTITVRGSLDLVPLQASIQALVAANVNKLHQGETLYRSVPKAAALSVHPDILEVGAKLRYGASAFADVDIAPPSASYIIKCGTVSFA